MTLMMMLRESFITCGWAQQATKASLLEQVVVGP